MKTGQPSARAFRAKLLPPILNRWRALLCLAALAAVWLASAPPARAAARFQTVHTFGDSTVALRDCRAPLMEASDGRLYGTTAAGGDYGSGVLFAMNPDGSGFTILWHFLPSFSGSAPEAPLFEGSDGRIYCVTTTGGSQSGGTLFWVLKDGGDYGVLVSFDSGSGTVPRTPLREGGDGKLYGATSSAGANGQGTVFSVNKDGGEFSVLHSFDGANDGGAPLGALAEGPDGALYGTARDGGANGGGTVFRLTTDGSEFGVLHAFDSSAGAATPAGLVAGSDGMFYGAARDGGSAGQGAIFRIGFDGEGFAILHSFDGGNDGATPAAGLFEGGDGALYGTTTAAGDNGAGTIYRIERDGSNFTVLRSPTTDGDGGGPAAGVAEGSDGALYGATGSGGLAGLIFKLDKDGNTFSPLWRFVAADGRNAATAPAIGSDDILYGTTTAGGDAGAGVIYRVTKTGSGYTVLRSLDAGTGTGPSALLAAGDGLLYGTAYGDGANGWGTLFKLNRDGSGFAVLRDFDFDNDGGNPATGLIECADGALYGTTSGGGANSGGTVFKINRDGSGFAVLRALDELGEGIHPVALTEGSDGKIYGVTGEGGENGFGAVFRANKDGSGFAALYSFTGGEDGGNPSGALAEGSGGALHGVARSGGEDGAGVVFKINKDGTGFAALKSFDGAGDGGTPRGRLAVGAGGALYGATETGGEFGGGTAFKVNPNGSGFTVLRSFDPLNDGGHPQAGLRLDADGALYGATYDGTVEDAGTLFWILENRPPLPAPGGPYSTEVGEPFTLNASASADPDAVFGDFITGYQWDLNSDGTYDISGLAPIVEVSAAQFAALGPVFPGTRTLTLRVTDNQGGAATASATLQLRPAISFTAQPQSLAVPGGEVAVFTATASSSKPFSYQWRFNGVNLPGETNNLFFVLSATRASAGAYSVVASNSVSTITSTNAQLRVLVPQRVSSAVKLANGALQLHFGDSDGGAIPSVEFTNFVVQASTNLAATNWVAMTNGYTFTNGAVRFLDTNTTLPRRFYRVISK